MLLSSRNSLLTLCGVTALYKATEALPHFLSPYLVDILIQVGSLCCFTNSAHNNVFKTIQTICEDLVVSILDFKAAETRIQTTD